MTRLLNFLRQRPELYEELRRIYGKTIGFWWLKTLYLKKVGLWNGERRIKILDDKEANKIIIEKLKSKEPFMVCRYGSTEFRNLFNDELENLCFYSGFFPNDKKLLPKFRRVYFEASKQIDYLCVWNYLNHFNWKRKWIRNFPNIKAFFSLGVLSHLEPWVKALEGKKVLVIHPFEETIKKQYKKMGKLKILPKLKKLEIIKAVQTIAGEKDERFKDWFEALDYMKKEIDKKDFDVALIGCGAYGLPLAAYVKQRGKQGIHVGGALQYFFGIKAKAIENKEKEMRINKYWTKPTEEEKPKNYKKIENGRYW
ncbi:MAG: hypothetical protein QXX68_01510 [Candidatus Pacearchaeota archaeon]